MSNIKTELNAQEIFFGQLNTLLSRGYFVYQQYLKFGKKLHQSILIKENNESIVKLILNKAYLFQEEQKTDLLLIVYHINLWRAKWDFLYENTHPKLDDAFIFETIIKFPRDSLKRLDVYYYKNFNKKLIN